MKFLKLFIIICTITFLESKLGGMKRLKFSKGLRREPKTLEEIQKIQKCCDDLQKCCVPLKDNIKKEIIHPKNFDIEKEEREIKEYEIEYEEIITGHKEYIQKINDYKIKIQSFTGIETIEYYQKEIKRYETLIKEKKNTCIELEIDIEYKRKWIKIYEFIFNIIQILFKSSLDETSVEKDIFNYEFKTASVTKNYGGITWSDPYKIKSLGFEKSPVRINMVLEKYINRDFLKKNKWISKDTYSDKPFSYLIGNQEGDSFNLLVRKNQCEDHSICLDLYTLSTAKMDTKKGGHAIGQKKEEIPGARIIIKLKENLSEYGDDKEQSKIRETFNKIAAAYYRQGTGLFSN